MARQVASSATLAGLFKGDSSANDEGDDEDGGNGFERVVRMEPPREVATVGGAIGNDSDVGRKHVSTASAMAMVTVTDFMIGLAVVVMMMMKCLGR
eukprot:CAMPEP_0119559800 /NCGR_PEP_ID=MMETSP1352-20130426/13350_1 /TAXON_ID=265584 /ORGANISM="Stauroneis constricta, Strain CCMP1120" /LENGTH=95 /DNA_ID=CAMNT_0007607589 /DNA_START=89 /DNA_END=376 /DNA_ORIENTATION=-